MFRSEGCQRAVWSFLCVALLSLGFHAVAQDSTLKSDPKDQGNAATSPGQGSQDNDPLKRPPSEKQRKDNSKH